MRIKVLSVKDIFKYLAKISLVFGIIAIFANFFYGNKNVKGFLNYDSGRFLVAIKSEVLLLNDKELNVSFIGKKCVDKALNTEFNIMKMATTNNTYDDSPESIQTNSDNILEDNQIEQNNTSSVEENNKEEIRANLPTQVLPSNIPDKTTYELFGVKIRNECDYNLENEITDLNCEFNKKDIIIFHTHTCESYTQTEKNQYIESEGILGIACSR